MHNICMMAIEAVTQRCEYVSSEKSMQIMDHSPNMSLIQTNHQLSLLKNLT